MPPTQYLLARSNVAHTIRAIESPVMITTAMARRISAVVRSILGVFVMTQILRFG
jgi:hypothetical protein